MKRIALRIFAVLVIGFVAIQLVPYGRAHTNPPVTAEPAWDSPATRELAARACFDCHSNETGWPWYSNLAPVSWLLQRHVDEGREKLNFSEWGSGEQETEDMAELVREGEMPPWDYLLLHPEARLSATEQQALIDGLTRTFGASGGGEGAEGVGGESGGSDDD
jgi:mono/diheme cytochrome c family protein